MAEFGGLTVGTRNYTTNTVKSGDNPIIKPKKETVVFNQRGTHAGSGAYNNFDWSSFDGNVMV